MLCAFFKAVLPGWLFYCSPIRQFHSFHCPKMPYLLHYTGLVSSQAVEACHKLLIPDRLEVCCQGQDKNVDIFDIYIHTWYMSIHSIKLISPAITCMALYTPGVNLWLMTSQFKDTANHTQEWKLVKCIYSGMGSKLCVKFRRCPLKFYFKPCVTSFMGDRLSRCEGNGKLRRLDIFHPTTMLFLWCATYRTRQNIAPSFFVNSTSPAKVPSWCLHYAL